MSVAAIDTATAARIATIDTQTTAAISAANDVMPDLEDLAGQVAGYYTVNPIVYSETPFDRTGVVDPELTALADADAALAAVNDTDLPGLTADSGSLLPAIRARLTEVQQAFSTLWQDVQAVPAGLGFNEDDYVADIIAEVTDAVADNLDDPDQETAHAQGYYDNDAVRRQTARTAEIDQTCGEFAYRGFSQAPETISDMRAFITAKHGMDDAQRRRMVILQQSTLSLENKQKAIAAGLAYDQILIASFERRQQRALAVAQATLRVIQDLADVKAYITGEQIAVQTETASTATENQRVVVAEADQYGRAFEARVDALLAKAGGFLDADSAEAQAYITRMRALNAERTFLVDERGTSVDAMRHNMANTLRAWHDSLAAFEDTIQIRINAASAAANLQLGLATAAKASITSVVGILSGQTALTEGTA
jgi:hypothetical protein